MSEEETAPLNRAPTGKPGTETPQLTQKQIENRAVTRVDIKKPPRCRSNEVALFLLLSQKNITIF